MYFAGTSQSPPRSAPPSDPSSPLFFRRKSNPATGKIIPPTVSSPQSPPRTYNSFDATVSRAASPNSVTKQQNASFLQSLAMRESSKQKLKENGIQNRPTLFATKLKSEQLEKNWNDRFHNDTLPEYSVIHDKHARVYTSSPGFRKRLNQFLNLPSKQVYSSMPVTEPPIQSALTARRWSNTGAFSTVQTPYGVLEKPKSPPKSPPKQARKIKSAPNYGKRKSVVQAAQPLPYHELAANTHSKKLVEPIPASEPSPTEVLFEKSKERIEKLWEELHIPVQEREHFRSLYFHPSLSFEEDYAVQENMAQISDEIAKLLAHRKDTLAVLKSVESREVQLKQLQQMTEAYSLDMEESEFEGSFYEARKPRKLQSIVLNREFQRLLTNFKLVSLETVESIQQWRDGLTRAKPFIWKGHNYLLKMQDDMDFFTKLPKTVTMLLLSEELVRTHKNPFLLTVPKIDETTPPDSGFSPRLPPLLAISNPNRKVKLTPTGRDPFRERILSAEKCIFAEAKLMRQYYKTVDEEEFVPTLKPLHMRGKIEREVEKEKKHVPSLRPPIREVTSVPISSSRKARKEIRLIEEAQAIFRSAILSVQFEDLKDFNATKIQAFVRGYFARAKASQFARHSHSAATLIQANFRGYKARKCVASMIDDIYAEREAIITELEALLRAAQEQDEYKAEQERILEELARIELEKTTILLQAFMRTNRGETDFANTKDAAILSQSFARSISERKFAHHAVQSIIALQSMIRQDMALEQLFDEILQIEAIDSILARIYEQDAFTIGKNCIIDLQSIARRKTAKQNYKDSRMQDLIMQVTYLQCLHRSNQTFEELVERVELEYIASVTIQKTVKGFITKRNVQRMLKDAAERLDKEIELDDRKTFAVLSIQSKSRNMMATAKVQEMKAIVEIQSLVRLKKSVKKFTSLSSNATLMQSIFRATEALNECANLQERVIDLQSLAAQKIISETLKSGIVIDLQSLARGRNAQEEYNIIKKNAEYLVSMAVCSEYSLVHNSCLYLQSVNRAWRTLVEYITNLLHLRRTNAITIQRVYRGYKSRNYTKNLSAKKEAILNTQVDREHAVLAVQGGMRTYLAQQRATALRYEQQQFEDFTNDFEQSPADVIQGGLSIDVPAVSPRVMLKFSPAGKQKVQFGGFEIIDEPDFDIVTENEAHDFSATLIQALFRSFRSRKQQRVKDEAIRIVQLAWLRHVALKEVIQRREAKRNEAAKKIVIFYQCVLAKRYLNMLKQFEDDDTNEDQVEAAAMTIQRFMNKNRCKKKVAKLKQKQEEEIDYEIFEEYNALKIQKTYRGHSSNLKILQLKYAAQSLGFMHVSNLHVETIKSVQCSALDLQSLVRRANERQELAVKRKSAILVQSLLRCSVEQALRRNQNNVSTKIQKLYRGYASRSSVIQDKREAKKIELEKALQAEIAAFKILRAMRKFIAKLKFKSRKQSADDIFEKEILKEQSALRILNKYRHYKVRCLVKDLHANYEQQLSQVDKEEEYREIAVKEYFIQQEQLEKEFAASAFQGEWRKHLARKFVSVQKDQIEKLLHLEISNEKQRDSLYQDDLLTIQCFLRHVISKRKVTQKKRQAVLQLAEELEKEAEEYFSQLDPITLSRIASREFQQMIAVKVMQSFGRTSVAKIRYKHLLETYNKNVNDQIKKENAAVKILYFWRRIQALKEVSRRAKELNDQILKEDQLLEAALGSNSFLSQ